MNMPQQVSSQYWRSLMGKITKYQIIPKLFIQNNLWILTFLMKSILWLTRLCGYSDNFAQLCTIDRNISKPVPLSHWLFQTPFLNTKLQLILPFHFPLINSIFRYNKLQSCFTWVISSKYWLVQITFLEWFRSGFSMLKVSKYYFHKI